ncbi:uncharacterized protein LOC135495495 [Lineus longissimus]|uniref:uncharacterized protein LOC135495495 n=1 Tax=Lineus longissimus TaxID=88925 RepID=UPI00315D6DA7
MALGHDVIFQSASIIWIFALFLTESVSKKTQTYYMDDTDCGDGKYLGGASVYSHQRQEGDFYRDRIECRITFKAENDGWKLRLQILELDIPDKSENSYICNDALYVYDANTIIGTPMKEAGGNTGLCGQKIPPVMYSTGPYLTVYFRTDGEGEKGRGFKLIITAFSDDYKVHSSCGANFQCDNTLCIDEDLKCDKIDHCGDYSDEASFSGASCDIKENNILTKFLSLGVTATIAISVGSIVVFVVCVACVACFCIKGCRKPNQLDQTTPGTTSTATHVVQNGTSHNYQNKQETVQYNPVYTHQGYHPMQPVYPNTPSTTYSHSPYVPQRETYTPQSNPPPSYHRSYTPTSSRSAKSNRSNPGSNQSNSVQFNSNHEKVTFPVHV